MREILFRGKSTENGKWIEGYYVKNNLCNFIITNNEKKYNVHPRSIGQYTGLKDKFGDKIFEGDFVETTGTHMMGLVKYENDSFRLFVDSESYKLSLYELMIVGNIHDNPEMLNEERLTKASKMFGR